MCVSVCVCVYVCVCVCMCVYAVHVMSAGMAGCIVRGPVSLHEPEEVDSVSQHTAAAGTRAGMQHDTHILPCPHFVTHANPYSSVLL